MNVDIIENTQITKLKAYVQSDSDEAKYYLAGKNEQGWYCSCPAWEHNPGEWCKHIMAVEREIE